jgi:hypothetical protein
VPRPGPGGPSATFAAVIDRASSPSDPPAPREPADPLEFGPSGYLPERASKRARKIVLRAPLGLGWVLASAGAGVVVLVAGLLLLFQSGDGPGAPYVEVGEVAALGPAQVDANLDALIVTAGGRVRAFADAADVGYCDASNRLEAPDGRVWSLTGRGLGTASLSEHPTVVHDGVLYVDPTRAGAAADPSSETVPPACS